MEIQNQTIENGNAKKPLVAVVGRPNVGKSTFFNKVAGRRISIVDNVPGVTRDRVYVDVDWVGYNFTLIDTGGLELKSDDLMWKHIRTQAELAIDISDVIIFLVDAKTGVTTDDLEVANMLRKSNKRIVLAVNKIDGQDPSVVFDFYSLGLGHPNPISAEQGLGIGDLLDEVVKEFDKYEIIEDDNVLKIAVVGKPNSGKSSLVNSLLGYERSIVTNVAGTTRDAIDTPIEYDGQKFLLIDTAGIRKKAKVSEDVEYYSVIRSIAAIKRADIVLIVIDAQEMLTEQDIKICGLVHEANKPSVILMNKWDLIEKDTNTAYQFTNKLKEQLKFMSYFKPLYISALTGKRVNQVLKAAIEVYENASRHISTGLLNEIINNAILTNEPPLKSGRRLKIYYAVQGGVNPPTFVFFVNDTSLIHFSYLRFLENQIRDAFVFEGTPIKLVTRAKKDSEF
ncbi:MAG TPA: ribosome biogenesis GTPase Der [Clostridiales bacterium]|nr:ribosome biogenesis GTPase Der [Clostridiales bacterium]